MLKGFKDFILRGNVVELAVAVVIGAAFGAVVTSLVNDVLNPLIAGIFKVPDLSAFATWEISDGKLPDDPSDDATVSFGALLNAIINFLLVAAAIYFAVVFPLNKIAERAKKKQEPVEVEAAGPTEIELLTQIRDSLASAKK